MRSTRLYQNIARKIQSSIEDGHYKIGDKLPPERDLATMFNVSKASIREAIIFLEISGLIEVKFGNGIYVKAALSQFTTNNDLQIHPSLQPHLEDNLEVMPFEILEARLPLEPVLAEKAAHERTEQQLEAIKQAYLMNVQDNLEHLHDHIGDRLFHIRIVEVSKNAAYIHFLKYLLGQQYTQFFSWLQKLYTPDDMPLRLQNEHYEIFSAIKKQDGKAAKLIMKKHIENVTAIFCGSVKNKYACS